MGGRKPTVSDDKILTIIADATDPVLSAPEIADQLTIGEQGTYQRLQDLEDRGLVESKKIGQGRAWWITDVGMDFISSS
nr:winged helix-turn-helix domain-containing protein [Halorientalis brevis]